MKLQWSKKLLCLALAVIVSAGLLTGCGKKSEDDAGSTSAAGNGADSSGNGSAPQKEPVHAGKMK